MHKCLPLQVIIYVDDANDEVPVFTQQQYNRLGLRETAGIGTSVIVVRATDPDTGESSRLCQLLLLILQRNVQNRERHLADCGFKLSTFCSAGAGTIQLFAGHKPLH